MKTLLLTFYLCGMLAGVAQAQPSRFFRQVGEWGDRDAQFLGVDLNEGHAYVVGGVETTFLYVVSVVDPAHPVEVGRIVLPPMPLAIAVRGDYAYVANDTSGLWVISIADPTRPVAVGRCSTGAAGSVVVKGDYVYVTTAEGLLVISVADPVQPVPVGRYHENGPEHEWRQVKVSGEYAYVADGQAGLLVVSVADPTNPVKVGQYAPGDVHSVATGGGCAYVGCVGGFRVASVADPANPVEVGRLDSAVLSPWGIVLIRGYAFVANGFDVGLVAISISDPTRPAWVGYHGGRFSWNCLATDGDYIFHGGGVGTGLRIYQFYQLGDLDVDNDSLDVAAATLQLRDWTAVPGESLECVRGEFVLANTSTSYNPDTIDGPSVSPVDSIRFTGSLSGPGGTIDSVVVLNLPESLVQGQALVCTLAAYMAVGLKVGDYTGWLHISGEDTAGLQVYESCRVFVRKHGDLDVDDDSLDVIAGTMRLTNLGSGAVGEFILANTNTAYNPDTADGPSQSPMESLGFTASLTGPSGIVDSILIPNLPTSLAQGQAIVCTLAVYVPPGLRDGDCAGAITVAGKDSAGALIRETFGVLIKNVLGDLDVDNDTLDVVHDTVNLHTQPAGPVYHPYAKARFMLVNTSQSYNPDAEDGPSRSPLREVEIEVEVEGQNGSIDSVYVHGLLDSLAVGQAVECTLALVIPVGESLGGYGGWITFSALDTLGYTVRDSFFLTVSGPQPRQTLDSLRVAPIPFKPYQNPEHDAIHFQGLSARARVIVYDASGQSVWSATESRDGHLKWDAKVASGIYVYLVVTADGKSSKVGKLSIIR